LLLKRGFVRASYEWQSAKMPFSLNLIDQVEDREMNPDLSAEKQVNKSRAESVALLPTFVE
jgi:hypothetical protein